MNGMSQVILIDLPLLMLGMGVIGAIAWNRNGSVTSVLSKGSPAGVKLAGIAALIGLWVLLTAASIWAAFLGGSVVCYLLLFWLGRAAAVVGLILLWALLVSIPFFWGWAVLRPVVRR